MRKILLIGVIVSFPILLLGQKDNNHIKIIADEPNLEFGYNLFSITNLHRNYIFDIILHKTDNHLFSGMFLKYHFKNNSFRFSFDYLKYDINEQYDTDLSGYLFNGRCNGLEIGLGYEKHFGNNKLIPFIFSNLFYNYSKSIISYDSRGCFWNINNELRSIYSNSFTLAMGIGLKYMITNSIAISYETNIQYGIEFINTYNSTGFLYDYNTEYRRFNPIRTLGISMIMR